MHTEDRRLFARLLIVTCIVARICFYRDFGWWGITIPAVITVGAFFGQNLLETKFKHVSVSRTSEVLELLMVAGGYSFLVTIFVGTSCCIYRDDSFWTTACFMFWPGWVLYMFTLAFVQRISDSITEISA